MKSKGSTYKRNGSNGTLILGENSGLAVAQALHKAALRALEDRLAETVSIDMATMDRLDMSTVQILLCLQRELESDSRIFNFVGLSSETEIKLADLGIYFNSKSIPF